MKLQRFLKVHILILASFFSIIMNSQNQTWAANAHRAHPLGHTLGLGILLGEPTGLNLKYWLNGNSALNLGIAYSFNSYMTWTGDWLYHFENIAPAMIKNGKPNFSLFPFVGVGATILFQTYARYNSGFALGIRIPIGLEAMLHTLPLGIWVEAAPGISIVPATWTFLQGGIGVRYYF